MGGQYNDGIGAAGLGAGYEGLGSIGHVSVEQRRRAHRYVTEEADLRYPEEHETPQREAWLEDMLSVLGLDQQEV